MGGTNIKLHTILTVPTFQTFIEYSDIRFRLLIFSKVCLQNKEFICVLQEGSLTMPLHLDNDIGAFNV